MQLTEICINILTSPSDAPFHWYETTNSNGVRGDLRRFSELLRRQTIRVLDTREQPLPADALLHDRRASVPTLVVSPRNEQEVSQALKAFKKLHLYDRVPLSVKSGGAMATSTRRLALGLC